jgi:hypothetical protein
MIHNILLLLALYPKRTICAHKEKKAHIQCKYVGMNFSHKNMGIVIQHVTRVCTNTDLTSERVRRIHSASWCLSTAPQQGCRVRSAVACHPKIIIILKSNDYPTT